jgi:two-component system, NtrC family, response regulator AtoC
LIEAKARLSKESNMAHALIVEDNVDAAELVADLVASQGFSVTTAHNLLDAKRKVALQFPDVVLLDLILPDGSGFDLLSDAKLQRQAEIILMTGYANLETSIRALRIGVTDFLVKPIKPAQLQAVLSRISKPETYSAAVDDLRRVANETGKFGTLIGRSPAMQRVYDQIAQVAGTAATVFITGESGTGKEVVAKTIHELSRRKKNPFLAVNCGAISSNLIESELFGHEKGSFTGADRQHQGFFERASGGTLFLDEVTEMPLDLQVKLLRVLETGSFMRVGSTTLLSSDVRIIAATNRPPAQAVATGKLREDLFYRLNVFPIELPPLYKRGDDVILLAEDFLNKLCQAENVNKEFTSNALKSLVKYSWPGNVRELRNAVQRAHIMAKENLIDATWLPVNEGLSVADEISQEKAAPAQITIPVGTSLSAAEELLILATLKQFGNHREKTAAALGISFKTLYNRLREYGLNGIAHAKKSDEEIFNPTLSRNEQVSIN